ncbi:MAG: beta-carotene 15,15'-dioxygenase, Brp/Blh family [Sphingomonadales bacterium]
MAQTQPIACEYLFAGAGASATLLLMQLEKTGMLSGSKVVVVDSDFTSLSRKTFCFWAKSDDSMVKDCRKLIQKSWNHLRIDRGETKSLKPLEYHCIPGLNMQNEMLALTSRNECVRLESSVISMVPDGNGVLVTTTAGVYRAAHVYDSRPAGFMSPKPNESALFQSFIGYVIEPEKPVLNTSAADMMDFGVEQHGATQFMYVLPMAADKVLVELTRFGTTTILEAEARPVLLDYIQKHFGNARIVETETGCIPMCSAPLRVGELSNVTRLGGRAGAIKPGTGYAFKNMYNQAVDIGVAVKNRRDSKPISAPPRFRFYDRLLLWILSHSPEWGKPIFQQLFRRNGTPQILRFLDEKTSWMQDVRILLSLPFKPFLVALRQDLRHNPPSISKPVLLCVAALLLLLLYSAFPSAYIPLQWILLSAGLLAIGIPHGAVDHLLETGKIQGKPALGFVAKYLGIMVLYLIFWQWFPVAAFCIFLLYSAFHFGQSDIQEWKISHFPNLKSFFWGTVILSVILFSHGSEVKLILGGMNIFVNGFPGIGLAYSAALLALLWGLFEKKTAVIWSVIMLTIGMSLPVLSAFGLYFIGQHSLNGWSHLREGMQAGNKSLFMKALPFTFGAAILLLTLFWMANANLLPWSGDQSLSLFFLFLACISMPHVWAMHRFYRRTGQTDNQ